MLFVCSFGSSAVGVESHLKKQLQLCVVPEIMSPVGQWIQRDRRGSQLEVYSSRNRESARSVDWFVHLF